MTDQFDIFKKLRDYETNPPPEVMLKIFNRLDDEMTSQRNAAIQGYYEQLQELEVNPPAHAFLFIKNKIDHSYKLSFLQNFEIAPPSWLLPAILNNLKPRKRLKRLSIAVTTMSIYRYRSVAAAVLVVIAGWIIFRVAGLRHGTEAAIGKASLPSAATKDSIVANADTANKNITEKVQKAGIIRIASGDYNRLSVNEYFFPVADNDILSTFITFNYGQVPAFINNDNAKRFIVRLDHYTAITVSEGMSRMITKMNSFRRNGKLTHRAKRTRSLLEKWKKSDGSQFDKSITNNPLDPIDLADFIFK